MTLEERLKKIIHQHHCFSAPVGSTDKIMFDHIITELTALVEENREAAYNEGYGQCAKDAIANMKKDGTGVALGHIKEQPK